MSADDAPEEELGVVWVDPTRPTRMVARDCIRDAGRYIEQLAAQFGDGIFVDLTAAKRSLAKAQGFLDAGDYDNACLQVRSASAACRSQEEQVKRFAFDSLLQPLAAQLVAVSNNQQLQFPLVIETKPLVIEIKLRNGQIGNLTLKL